MDNASKALIMAGAILISVAIVGIGIYIFSVSNSITDNAVGQVSSLEVQTFNNQFYTYAYHGDIISASEAKALWTLARASDVAVGGVTNMTGFDSTKNYKIVYTPIDNSAKITKITFTVQP